MTIGPIARATICSCIFAIVGFLSGLLATPVADADSAATGGASFGSLPHGPNLPTPAGPSAPATPAPVAPAAPTARPLQDGTQAQAIVAQAVATISTHVMRPGSRGRLVLALQNLLQEAGLNVIVTGRYDSGTVREVRRFQRKKRMKVTGIADPPTTAALATAAIAAASSAPADHGWIFPLTPVGAVESPSAWSLDQGVDLGGSSSACGPKMIELAVADATVVKLGVDGFGPAAPVLRLTSGPDAGRYVYYGHAAPALVKVGQRVVAGQAVAELGCGIVGRSSTPHLELGISASGGGPCCPGWGETAHETMTQLTYAYKYARAHPAPPPPLPTLSGAPTGPLASAVVGTPEGGAPAAP